MSRRHRDKTTPCPDIFFLPIRRRSNAPPIQHDVVSTRRRVNMRAVSKRSCVNTTHCQDDAVPRRRCVNTTSCQDGVVSRRHRLETTSCEDDTVQNNGVVSKQFHVKSTPFQYGIVSNNVGPRRCRINKMRRYSTVSCQERHRVKTAPSQKTVSCKHNIVSIRHRAKNNIVSKLCRVNMTSCQHDVVSSRHRGKNEVVPTRRRIKTTSCHHVAVPPQCRFKQHRVKHDAVSR